MLENQWLTMIKWLILLVFLIVITIRDIKEYRIPNNILLFALGVRFVIFIIEIFINKIKLETLLLKNSDKYKIRSKRAATKISYNKVLLMYFVWFIAEANK